MSEITEGHTYKIPISLLDEWSREGEEMEEAYETVQRWRKLLVEIRQMIGIIYAEDIVSSGDLDKLYRKIVQELGDD